MQDALNEKQIFYAIDEVTWEHGGVFSFAAGNSYRTSYKFYEGTFHWIRQAFYDSLEYSKYAGPSQWNDLGPL